MDIRKFYFIQIFMTIFIINSWSLYAVENEIIDTYLNSHAINNANKAQIIQQLIPATHNLTDEQWQCFTAGSDAFITPDMSSDEKTLILTTTIKAPLETLGDSSCIKAAKKFIPSHVKGIELAYLIATLINIPAEKLKDPSFIKTAQTFIASQTPNHERIIILKKIGEIPLEILTNPMFIPSLYDFLPDKLDSGILISTISLVTTLAPENWANFQKTMKKFIPHEMNSYQKIAIMEVFATVPQDVLQESSFLKTAHHFINPRTTIKELIFLLKTLSCIPIKTLKNPSFIPTTTSFVSSSMSILEQASIFKSFGKIPDEYLGDFANVLNDFKVFEMNNKQRVFVIENVAEVTPEKWQDLEVAVSRFFTREMSLQQYIDILISFTRIPTENWEDFQRVIITIIKPQMSSDKRFTIIKTIAELLPEKFQTPSFPAMTCSFLITGLTADDCRHIIQEIASLPQEIIEYLPFAEIVNALASPKMCTSERIKLMKTLAIVPVEKLKNPAYITITRTFLSPHLRVDDWCQLIEATSLLSDEVLEKSSFPKHASALITQDMSIIQQITILKIFGKLPIDHWKIFRNLLSDLKTIRMDSTERIVIIIKTGGLLIDSLFSALLARPDFIEKSIEDRITGIKILSSINTFKRKDFSEATNQFASETLRLGTSFDILEIFKKAKTHIDENDPSKIPHLKRPLSSSLMDVDSDR